MRHVKMLAQIWREAAVDQAKEAEKYKNIQSTDVKELMDNRLSFQTRDDAAFWLANCAKKLEEAIELDTKEFLQ